MTLCGCGCCGGLLSGFVGCVAGCFGVCDSDFVFGGVYCLGQGCSGVCFSCLVGVGCSL